MTVLLILILIIVLFFLSFSYYSRPPNMNNRLLSTIILTLLCMFGCALGAILGGPAAICRAVLLGLALFAVVPVIEKANHVLPRFRILQAGLIGACAGLTAGCMMAIFDPILSSPAGMETYNTAMSTLIIFSGVYGLLVHAAFKASEKRHIAIRFLSVLAAMCLAFILRFHPLVFQTAQPLIILNVIAASAPSCIFIALLWWLPAERLKILYRSDLASKEHYFNFKCTIKIAISSMIACFVLSSPMIDLVMNHDDFQFEINNNNQKLKKSLSGRIFTKNYIYECNSGKKTQYQAPVSDLIKYCHAFDVKDNVMCISNGGDGYSDNYTDIIFTDIAEKKIRINTCFVYISISPDCRELAGLSNNGCIKIYEIASGKLINEISGYYADSFCWSMDGKNIFAVLPYKGPKIFSIDIASGSAEELFSGDMPRLIQCDGKIAYKDKNSIKIYSPESKGTIIVGNKCQGIFYGYTVSPCGKYLIYLKKKLDISGSPRALLLVKKIYEHEPGIILGEVTRRSGFSASVVWQDSQPTQPKKVENAELK